MSNLDESDDDYSMKIQKFDGPLTCVASEGMEDWYLIEKRDHDGREWMEKTGPNSFAFMTSARIGNADIEGRGAEMRKIAEGILAGYSIEFRRCGVVVEGDHVFLWSPRNSSVMAEVPLANARTLAAEILAKISVQDS